MEKNFVIQSPKGLTYKITSFLGKGQFGDVYLVIDNANRKYAMKVIDLDQLKVDQKLQRLFHNEITIMEEINHPRILKLYDKFQYKERIILITRYCEGGNLGQFIEKVNSKHGSPIGLGEKVANNFLRQIVEGFYAMVKSNQKIIHRDLKLENIFLSNNEIVIGDFGFAKLGESQTGTGLGTPFYMAPEVLNLKEQEKYSNKCDIWSMGVCYFYLIFGYLPFREAKNKYELYQRICVASGSRLNIPKKLSFPSENLLRRMLE